MASIQGPVKKDAPSLEGGFTQPDGHPSALCLFGQEKQSAEPSFETQGGGLADDALGLPDEDDDQQAAVENLVPVGDPLGQNEGDAPQDGGEDDRPPHGESPADKDHDADIDEDGEISEAEFLRIMKTTSMY